jgi:PAS domain S-box-containing protein
MSALESSTIGPHRRPSAPLAPASVLVIDAAAAVCHTLSSLLAAEGHTVATAQSGKDAVKLLQSRQFDVVLTDLLMPEMDGLQTMEALKDLDPDLEVIVLTGHAAIRVATEALKRGACDYLQKPVSLLELSAAVERAVELRRLKSGNCLEGVTGVPGALGRRDPALSQLIKRQHAEEELRLTRFAVDHASDAVFWMDWQGRIVYANEAACRSVGRTREEVLALSILDIDPRVAQTGWEKAWQLVKERRSMTFETQHRRKDGTVFPVEVSAKYLEFGGKEYSFTFVRDITERKRSQEVKALLASIVESSEDAIIGKALDGTILSWNKGAENLYGYSADEVMGKPVSILAPADRYDELPNVLERIRRGEKIAHFETVRLRKDGATVHVAVTVSPIMNASGEVTGAATIARDITERQRVEDRLRELSRAVEQSPAAVVITDVHGAIEYVNPKFTQITGYTAAEVKGQNPRILKSGMQSPIIYEGLWTTILSGGEWRGEFANKKKSGEIYWESASIVPIRDSAGTITHFLAVKEDITERKRAEEELRRAKEAAEAANRAKSQFLANMSHEIRTPMNGVIGMAGLLLDTELSLEQRRYAEIVRSSGEALLAVINDILDFSKIEARRLNLECADFDLRSVLEYAASLVGIKTSEKKLELLFEVVPGTPCLLRGDAGRLRQVLVNLLGNAVKFTPQGEVAVTVRVDSEDEQKATLHFTVRDTGIGFRQEQASVLFEPFVQADGSKTRRYGGTGLGLAISKQLVEMMGGQIGVRSQEGKGATFWFTAAFEKQPAASAPSTGIQPDLRGARVLVVDDNATNRHLLCALLRSWGCRPEESADAGSALSVLQQAARTSQPFQIAILDLDLPDVDGVDLGRRIATDPELKPTALYLMTGFGRFVAGARLHALGFAGQIAKPIWERKLLETLLATSSQGRASEAPPSISQTASGRAGAEPKFRILVAEDNPTNQEVAGMILRKLGFSADLVGNGLEALQALQQRAYDLLLLDCEMPEMDGYETARRIRDPRTGARNPLIPIVALTADAIAADREKCFQAGMNDYLAKPVEPRHLAEVLGKWLAAPAAPAGGKEVPRMQNVFRSDTLMARLSGDRELVRKVVAGFLSRLPQQVACLRQCVEKGDAQGTCRQAHALKGSAATVSAESLRAVCCELEDAAEAGNFNRASDLLPKLEEAASLLTATATETGWV